MPSRLGSIASHRAGVEIRRVEGVEGVEGQRSGAGAGEEAARPCPGAGCHPGPAGAAADLLPERRIHTKRVGVPILLLDDMLLEAGPGAPAGGALVQVYSALRFGYRRARLWQL